MTGQFSELLPINEIKPCIIIKLNPENGDIDMFKDILVNYLMYMGFYNELRPEERLVRYVQIIDK